MNLIERIEGADGPEMWKVAAGTAGQYEVSNLGRVRRSDGLMLVPSVPRNRREYPAVMLRHSGTRRRVAVHRLVALNFIGLPPHAGAEVRHLDGDHLNYVATNLAWGTRAENAADRALHGTAAKGEKHGMFRTRRYDGSGNPISKLTEDDVRAIRASSLSQKELARQYGVHKGVIWRVVRRKGWLHV